MATAAAEGQADAACSAPAQSTSPYSTHAPFLASASAIARPIPRAAPVTKATWFDRSTCTISPPSAAGAIRYAVGVDAVGAEFRDDAFDLAADVAAQLRVGVVHVHQPHHLPAALALRVGGAGLFAAELRQPAAPSDVVGDAGIAGVIVP